MIDRVNKVIIGKDISRTSSLVIYAIPGGSADNVADGEVFVVDKNKKLLSAGATIADSEYVYVGVGLGSEVTLSNEAGTSITTRRLEFSDPIYGKFVKSYIGKAYTARTEKTVSFVNTGLTPVAGTEYILRVIYKDMVEHPGQFIHTYRHIATSTETVDSLFSSLANAVNAHTGRRVNASVTAGSDLLTLTAIQKPEGHTSLNDIDEDSWVNFDAFIVYVDSDGYWTNYGATKSQGTPVKGSGTWYQVRDREKGAFGYKGIMNRTAFPVIMPDFRTVKDETYDAIIIESSIPYKSPDNQYYKDTQVTTEIYIPNTATSNQMDQVLAVLNPWMASCPGNFSAVSF
jgi:hypothetical protein